MREVTIYRHEDGIARVIPWSDRENPPEEEVFPQGAKLTMYTIMPYQWINMIRFKTQEEVNAILSRFIP